MEPLHLIGSKEVCRLLDIDKSTLSRWIQSGRIAPAQKMPGKNGIYLFDPAAVEALKASAA